MNRKAIVSTVLLVVAVLVGVVLEKWRLSSDDQVHPDMNATNTERPDFAENNAASLPKENASFGEIAESPNAKREKSEAPPNGGILTSPEHLSAEDGSLDGDKASSLLTSDNFKSQLLEIRQSSSYEETVRADAMQRRIDLLAREFDLPELGTTACATGFCVLSLSSIPQGKLPEIKRRAQEAGEGSSLLSTKPMENGLSEVRIVFHSNGVDEDGKDKGITFSSR